MPKILCIDDEEVILKILNIFLQSDYDVTVSNNGLEGLELGLTGNYDVIITDIRMPGKTGTEIIAALEEAQVDTKVIIMTSHPMSLEENSSPIVASQVQKPVNKQIIQDAVKAALEGVEV